MQSSQQPKPALRRSGLRTALVLSAIATTPNFRGIPKEPYGFSNCARGSAGPPKFSAAVVTLNPDGITRIVLK